MRSIVLSLLVLGCSSPSRPAANEPAPSPEPETRPATTAATTASPTATAPTAFPGDWIGRWHGTVSAASGTKRREFGMILDVRAVQPGRWSWTITYALDDGENVRKYELVEVDSAIGRFQIDEKNGIVIDATVVDNSLYTLFDVGGSQIDFRYTMTPEGIRVDVVSSTPAKATTTGGGEVPEVKNLPLGGVQRALLTRVPDPS